MTPFDMRTVVALCVVSYLLCTLFVLQLWRQNHKRFAGLGLWAVGLATQTASLVLVVLRGSIPDWLSIVVANVAVLGSTLLIYRGLERFIGKPGPQLHHYALLAVHAAAFVVFTFLAPDLHARTLVVSVTLFVVCGECVWLLWARVEPALRPLTFPVGLVLCAYCAINGLRIVKYFFAKHAATEYFQLGTFDTLMMAAYQTLTVLLTFNLVLMVNRRLALDLGIQEAKFEKAFHFAPTATLLTRLADGVVIDANVTFLRLTGCERAEVLGKRMAELPLWARLTDRTAVAESLKKPAATRAIEVRLKSKAGADGLGLLCSDVVSIAGEQTALSCVIDLTERRRMELDVEESREKFRALSEASFEAIYISEGGKCLELNQRAVQLFGYSAEESIGRHGPDLVVPEQREQVSEHLKENYELPYESVALRKDGSTLPVLIRGKMMSFNGRTVRVTSVSDISERKRAEAQRAVFEQRLRETQKLEAIGTLAGGIAHDFNNILATILGNAELARQDAAANSLTLESLEEIRKAGSRARDLVRQILSFGRRQPTRRTRIALAPVVEESVRLLRATLPARLTLEVHCEAGTPPVMADATQLEQVLINLSTNAMQAIGPGPGRIAIRLDAAPPDLGLAREYPAVAAMYARHSGPTVRLAVTDDGHGMDAGTQARIFEPFFTTKPVDMGTGLGLSVVHGIVQAHDGAIVVSSQPGKGSTFTIHLPAAGSCDVAASPSTSHRQSPAPIDSAPQHILYLDDDKAVALVTQRLLERRGFRVTAFLDPAEALAALRADPARFDMVVTDNNMPGLSGLDVAREVRAIRSDLPVAVASGFIDEDLRVQAAGAGVRELIFKADGLNEFCDAVGRLSVAVQPKTR
jgi:PAS domain S-box-containing protein